MQNRRDVGEMGEKLLEQWCAQVGITANRASRDRAGWDYLLEFPPAPPSDARPLDHQPRPLQTFVQVKATDQRRRSWSVKLDNWWRLVTTASPAFFLILEFAKKSVCQGAYLVHVDATRTRAVLECLRRFGERRPELPMHKGKLALTWDVDDAVATLDGEGLVQAIQRHVGVTPSKYMATKASLLQSLGYETGGQTVAATVLLPEGPPAQTLVNFALGLTPDLKVAAGAEVWDERFGIPYPKPIHIIPTEGRLRSEPAGFGQLRLTSHDGETEVLLDVEAYSSGPVARFLRSEKVHIRFANKLADFFWNDKDIERWSVRLHIPAPDAPFRLDDLMAFAQLVSMLSGAKQESPVNAEVNIDRFRFSGDLQLFEPIDLQLIEIGKAIRCSWRIAKRMQLPTGLQLAPRDIWRQRSELTAIDAAFRGDTLRARIDFGGPPEVLTSALEICLPTFLHAWLGEYVFAVGIAYFGRATRADAPANPGETYFLDVQRVVAGKPVQGTRETPPQTSPQTLLDAVSAMYDPTHLAINWWDNQEDANDPGAEGIPG